MANIGQWNGWFREHGDLILKARTTDDIRAAKEQGKTLVGPL
jgi:membrane dipeptidase